VKTAGLLLVVMIYWALHQDLWFWRQARPLVFGFVPIGLAYHALYTLGIALLMLLLVKTAWPTELEKDVDRSDD
jgi:hypothetical protein